MNKYKTIKQSILFCLCFLAMVNLNAQSDWKVTADEGKNLSPFMFDEDMSAEGRMSYNNSCTSCHGTPGQDDYTPMSPPPGDPASDQFQLQSDGSLFFKIKTGRNSMPKFEDVFSPNETWNIIAYIRSFNENYKQEIPDLGDIIIPEYKIRLSFDDNVDKLVVKVFDNEIPQPKVDISAFVKGMFGKYLLGKTKTNDLGIAYIDVDAKLPGDKEGMLNLIVKATKGYGSAKITQKLAMVAPSTNISVIDGRHIWSTDKMAPIWLKSTFFITIISVWSVILLIVFGLRKINQANKED